MAKGLFIAIEGIGGAGKKTLAEALELQLAEKGVNVVVTAEPSDAKIGHRIRKILDGKLPAPKTNLEFQRLYVKDRLEHIRCVIRPHLNLGNWVLSIHYWLSTFAYGMLDGKLEEYLKLHEEIMGDEEMLYPNLTLLLDLDVDEALLRIQQSGQRFDWFAKKEKLEKIRKHYLFLAERKNLGEIYVLDAMQSKEEVLKRAIAAIESRL